MRLFAGIELPHDVQTQCVAVAERLRAANLEARYEQAEKLHITLAFIGNVDPARFDEIIEAVNTAATRCRAFDMQLDRVGAFPHERRPRIVWVGSRAQGPAYRELATATRSALEARGFAFEDDAIAHVTIARIKGGGMRPVPLVDIAPIPLRVDAIALFESLPASQSTRYEVRLRAALRD
jgi:RNA 2',3'-cyclic 3'-phosphodiesterase